MELVFLGTVLVAAMATVDIPETPDAIDEASSDPIDSSEKPYGVHG